MKKSINRLPTKRIPLSELAKSESVPIVLIKNYSILEEFVLESGNNSHKYYTIPESIKPGMPIESEHKITNISRLKLGKATQLPKRQFFESLFLRNEILACKQMAMTRIGITREYRREFPQETKQHYNRFSDLLRKYKNEYNTRKLYVNQPPLILWAFNYSTHGYITHTSKYNYLLSFKYCRRLLMGANFADPRFFTEAEIDKYRKYSKLGWATPDKSAVNRIERQIGKPLYNSIQFPDGYTKEYDPI